MRNSKSYLYTCLAAVVLLGAASLVHAVERDSYVGFSLGSAGSDDSAYDSALGWKVFAGTAVGRHFSLQAGYINFGEMDGPPGDTGETIRLSTTGFEFSTIGQYPFADRFAVFAKLGFLIWNSKWDNKGPTGGLLTTGDSTMLYGLGARFDLSERIGFEGGWEHYSLDDDTTMLSASVIYRF